MDRPLVSIVTTSYNQARFLDQTLDSIQSQGYPRIEHLVIDDGSTDGSRGIIERRAGELAWFDLQENKGQVAALNRAFSHTRGDLLAFVNGDDTLLPGAVSRAVGELEREPDALLVYGDMVYTDDESRQIGYVAATDWDPARSARTGLQFAPQPASFWTRRAWEIAGPFNERAWSLFDEEFFLRIASVGRVVRIPKPLATFRLHDESKSLSRHEQMAEECIRFADEFWGGSAPTSLRRHARSGRATYYRRAALNLAAAGDRPRARRLFLHSLILSPRGLNAKQASRLARTCVPVGRR